MEEEKIIVEENAITLKDVVKILLGNKWLYLIMAALFLIVSVVGLSVYSNFRTNYVVFYDYDVAGFSTSIDESGSSTAKYIDGEKFDPRSIVTKEKLKEYFETTEELKGLDIEDLYKSKVIKSFKYTVKYIKNDHKKDEKDVDYIEDSRGYELVLNSKLLDKEQAKALSEAIANEVIKASNTKIDKIQYHSYLNYYDSINNYPEKVSSLNSGINYLKDLSNSLIGTYGDVLLKEGKYGGEEDKYYLDSQTISNWQKQLDISFDSYYVSSLQSELEVNGFITNDSITYVARLKTSIANLNRDIAVNEALLQDLKTQRDNLVSSIGTNASIESVEIAEYNAEIISLTKTIAEKKEQVDLYELQLERLDTSSFTPEQLETYMANLANFETKLKTIRDNLEFFTNQYEAIAKETMKNDSHVYFDSPNVVKKEGELSKLVIVGGSLAIGVFAPMFVNLAIAAFNTADGKPLSFRKKEKR